jgi:hypothetical protein
MNDPTTYEFRCGRKRLFGRLVTVANPDGSTRQAWEFECDPWPELAARWHHSPDTDGAYWEFLDRVLGLTGAREEVKESA